ncbi:MAG: sodium:calcium antiporter [Desulfobacteraceae bacterium]|nr:sodium:calcium antiporter [Desulfobacteraceae bacterium]MCF8094832.1 sodium:calcium antiporter [Desulfobacteraceae bacterium]
MLLATHIFIIIASTVAVWYGSFRLESAACRLAAYYRLPAVVQGSIIMAVGSSFPELSSTVIATLLHGTFELGVAVIVGSAIFNILVIPGLSGLIGKELETNKEQVYKDALFYIISVTVLLLVFAFALIYYPVEGARWEGTVTRPIALIPVALYGLYIFLQHQDTVEHQAAMSPEDCEAGTDTNIKKMWIQLALSLAIIAGGVEGLVRSAIVLGDLLNTPHFFWGLTIIAAATSLPDTFVSIQAARRGNGIVSIANVLGSNIFDLLIAIPIGVLIAGSSVVDFAVAAPTMGVLTLATIVLFTMLRTQLRVSRTECGMLLVLYAVFILWTGLETFGVIDFLFI